MTTLSESLQDHDLRHLRTVADMWGIDLKAPDANSAVPELVRELTKPHLLAAEIDTLPDQVLTALGELIRHNGRLPWSQFIRDYGELRTMGPARRDREQPHLNPISTTEVLWYHALVGRAFFDTPSGLREFAYLPSDLIPLLPVYSQGWRSSLGRSASPGERAHLILASDNILDSACTLLAALRLSFDEAQIEEFAENWPIPPSTLLGMLSSAKIVDTAGNPLPEATRSFLESDRGEALAQVAHAWYHSVEHNDLREVPHLLAEGGWQNDPLNTRRTLMGFLNDLPKDIWWSLPAFINDVREHHPDFQRTAGDFDSWYLRDKSSGEYRRGFEHWDDVDGALINYLITGPMHWLGIVDLASPKAEAPAIAFRFSKWSSRLLEGTSVEGMALEDAKLIVDSQFRLRIPNLVQRAARYQIARFCEWQGISYNDHLYRITPRSLVRAVEQGLRVNQLLALLARHAASPLPLNLVKALQRWQKHGTQARVEDILVLRLESPDILDALRSSRASRFLGDPLGPAAVVVKQGAWEKVLQALAELGYLGEIKSDID
jgi:hypothetical protein